MKPFKAKKLPFDIKYGSELVNLLGEANKYYGEALGSIKSLGIDKKLYISSLLRSESYKSTQIEGTNISQFDMFSIEYESKQSDDAKEILNYSRALEYGQKTLTNSYLNVDLLNELHKIILDSVRGNNKKPGNLRTIQNLIGPRGLPIENADFIPPVPEDIVTDVDNLVKYFYYEDENPLIVAAIFHAQFETIHPYNDGNGRLGRLLIPLQIAALTGDEPILFLSELIEQYKPSYGRCLNDYRKNKETNFIKFFLQCAIDQSRVYIYRTAKIKELITRDRELIVKEIKNNGYNLFQLLVKRVVVNAKLLSNELEISSRTANNYLNKLIDLNIIAKNSGSSNYVYLELLKLFNPEN